MKINDLALKVEKAGPEGVSEVTVLLNEMASPNVIPWPRIIAHIGDNV